MKKSGWLRNRLIVHLRSVARNEEQRFRRKQTSTHDVEIMSACLILARFCPSLFRTIISLFKP